MKVGPDLIVTAMSAPASAAAGATISVTDTTKNQGAGTAACIVHRILPVCELDHHGRRQIHRKPITGQLAANGTSTISTPLQIPADTLPGSYYVIGRADWNGNVAETSDTNNDRSSGVNQDRRRPGGVGLVCLCRGHGGRADYADRHDEEQGAAPVTGSLTGFYLSSNGTLDAADQLLGSRVVESLGASGTDTASTEFIIPAGTAPEVIR